MEVKGEAAAPRGFHGIHVLKPGGGGGVLKFSYTKVN
jgi:hypothetical protein